MNRAIFISFLFIWSRSKLHNENRPSTAAVTHNFDILLTGFSTAGFLPVSGNFYFVVSKPKHAYISSVNWRMN